MRLIGFCESRHTDAHELGGHLAASLEQFGDLTARTWRRGGMVLCDAFRPARPMAGGRSVRLPPWTPATAPSGAVVVFSGWLDNWRDLAATLGVSSAEAAAIYGAAVDRWGDAADSRCIGSYAAIVCGPAGARLSRSPWSAPPLHYFREDGRIAAASTSRALLACGLASAVNRQRLADSLVLNLTSADGWYAGERLVRLGEIVHLGVDDVRCNQWYDPLDPPPGPRFASKRDYVEAADALLTEAVAATAEPYRQPGVFLSGGLDSTNIAARALKTRPGGARLPAFTFLPRSDWQDDTGRMEFGSEEHLARQFAEANPAIDLHFSRNEDRGFAEVTQAMVAATGAGLPLLRGTWVYDGLLRMASDKGCDVVFAGWGGNATFSNSGDWAFPEYLRRGRLLALYRILRDLPHRRHSIAREFIRLAVIPNLPLGRQQRRLARHGKPFEPANFAGVPIRAEAMARYALAERAEAAGLLDPALSYASRGRRWAGTFAEGDGQIGDIQCAWFQMHGVAVRDVTMYRPLVELCRTAPTEVFRGEGVDRWLAREMGRGLIPETIRAEKRTGLTGGDWHIRLKERLPAMAEELERASEDPDLAEIIDFDVLRARLETFPEARPQDQAGFVRYEMAIPNALAAARFVRHVTGRN